MAVVENCVVWKLLKSLNLKQRGKLLAAIFMTFQETVEGNSNRSTSGRRQDFVDWGRRWGTDEMDAQVTLINQWDNILHHLIRIAAAMEVWPSQTPHRPPRGKKITRRRKNQSPALVQRMGTTFTRMRLPLQCTNQVVVREKSKHMMTNRGKVRNEPQQYGWGRAMSPIKSMRRSFEGRRERLEKLVEKFN